MVAGGGRGDECAGERNVEQRTRAAVSWECCRGEKHRVFYVTPQTKINKEKIPATLNALAIGDYVGGYAREKADGKLELVTLNIGEAVGKARTMPVK